MAWKKANLAGVNYHFKYIKSKKKLFLISAKHSTVWYIRIENFAEDGLAEYIRHYGWISFWGSGAYLTYSIAKKRFFRDACIVIKNT